MIAEERTDPSAYNAKNRIRGAQEMVRLIAARRLHVWALALIVFGFGLQQNLSSIQSTKFHPDESRWLNRAHYTKDLLDPLSSVWADQYLVRGQPPGGSYITGVGLLLQGRDFDTNAAWDFHYGNETVTWWNTSRGGMPSWDDLVAARRTSAVLGAITAMAVFLIVAQLANVVGGVAAGLFIAVHPLSVYLSSLGVSDAAFSCIVALTTLAGMGLARKPTWGRTVVFGLLLGAGAATKLSPLFIAIGMAGIGFVFVIDPLLRRITPFRWMLERIPGSGSPTAAALGWKLISLPFIAGLTFFLSYPYLWPSPVARTRNLFVFRKEEMDNQARIWPDQAVTSRLNGLNRAWHMLEDRYSASGRVFEGIASAFGRTASGHGYDLPFAIIGLALLLLLTWKRGVTSPSFFAVVLIGAQSALILGGMKVDFDRYYLPIVFAFAIGFGVFVSAVWSIAAQNVERMISREKRGLTTGQSEGTRVPSHQGA